MTEMRAVNTNAGLAIPFRLEFLLDYADLVDALAYSVKDDGDDPLPNLSQAAVIERVRDTLRHVGAETYHYWADYLGNDHDREAEITAWAHTAVQRVFGTLLDTLKEQ